MARPPIHPRAFLAFPFRPQRAALCTLALLGAAAAHAQPIDAAETPSVYLQVGRTSRDTSSWTLGVTRPWSGWQKQAFGGQVSAHWDLYASQWRTEGANGAPAHSTTSLGIAPIFRLRPDGGRSAWFAEGGVGLLVSDHRYTTPRKAFSTRWNFATQVAVGRSFGAQRQHEWTLRLQHVSNAGIKKPNPGENFVQLRYALHF